MKKRTYRFIQYPRGDNKGGVLDTDICPTITVCSWQHNVLLMEKEEDDEEHLDEDKGER